MSEVTSSAAHSYAGLLSLAVHEFRTPASVVGGYLRMLQSGVGGALSDPQRKMIGEAEKSCARIVELIGELSDIGKLEGGTITLKEEPIDLFQLISEVASDVHEAEDREVHLEVRGTAAGAWITGDRRRLAGALSVFLRAILREQPSATTVVAEKRLEQTPEGFRAMIVVARHDFVRQTYDSDPAPFDELRGGLGLGLPLARRIVEHYMGQVWTPASGSRDRQGLIVAIPVQSSDRSEG
jgi:signal transduction histidine kinase